MTVPAVYAEGLRVLWLLFSRGVSATWDGTAVGVAPPDPTADGAIEELEAVLRPDADGRSYLQRARARHAPFLREVNDARPADATNRQWRSAIEGLESFLLSGWGDEALGLGWPRDELYAVPPLWSRVDLCGAGLLIGDGEVISVTSSRIGIRTPNGSEQGFYRRPTVDYGVAFRARIKSLGDDGLKEEPRLRALEAVVSLYRNNHPNADVDTAKAAVLAAITGEAR
jgi:hypothetical protein